MSAYTEESYIHECIHDRRWPVSETVLSMALTALVWLVTML